MSDNKYNSFVKKEKKYVFSKEKVISTIPKDATKNENPKLVKTHTELRWRIFKIPNKENEIIEISYKKPNEKRMYMNKNCEYVKYEENDEFDKYVVNMYYFYEDREY